MTRILKAFCYLLPLVLHQRKHACQAAEVNLRSDEHRRHQGRGFTEAGRCAFLRSAWSAGSFGAVSSFAVHLPTGSLASYGLEVWLRSPSKHKNSASPAPSTPGSGVLRPARLHGTEVDGLSGASASASTSREPRSSSVNAGLDQPSCSKDSP